MRISKKDKIYVVTQFLVFLAFLVEVDRLRVVLPENLRWIALWAAGIGGILVLGGLLQLKSNLTPFPSPTKNARLVTSGVFAFARHPIYSGILFMAFGLSFWLNSGYKLGVSVVLLSLFYAKTRYEEKKLQERFPDYVFYKRETGRFFPKFRWRI